MKKEQAIEILNARLPRSSDDEAKHERNGAMVLLDALAAAGAFTGGAGSVDVERKLDEVRRARLGLPPADPSRPVANQPVHLGSFVAVGSKDGARERASDALLNAGIKFDRVKILDALESAGLFCEPRTIAVGSKARAEKILREARAESASRGEDMLTPRRFLDALDRAQFFADEATLAEIAELVERVAEIDRATGNQGGPWRPLALALAIAARKLGIGVSRE